MSLSGKYKDLRAWHLVSLVLLTHMLAVLCLPVLRRTSRFYQNHTDIYLHACNVTSCMHAMSHIPPFMAEYH
eukprot:3940556-Rhodomonas_salina.1